MISHRHNYITILQKALKRRVLFIVFALLFIAFAVLTYKDYGLTLDEYFVYTRGQYYYTYLRGDDPSIRIAFTEMSDNNHNRNLLFKNSSYPALLYIFNDAGVLGEGGYENYHLLNMLFGLLAFWIVYEILLAAKIKPLYALVGPILLFFTPRFLGHLPANPKDLPYAVFYLGALWMMYINRKLPVVIRVLGIGLAIGLTASIRQVGFILLPIYGLFRLYETNILDKKNTFAIIAHEFAETVAMFMVGYLVLVFTYPYLQTHPIDGFIQLLKINAEFPWSAPVLLFGKEYLPDERPWTYMFIWFLISTPIFVLALFSGSVKKLARSPIKALIWGSLIVNFGLYLILRPVVYDGTRHFLFIIPHLVILATLVFNELVQDKKVKKILLGVFAAHVLLMSIHYVTLHPYQYTYFNEFVGNLPGAQNGFERDYWGASDKEAMLWLKDYLAENNIQLARVGSCSQSSATEYYLSDHVNSNDSLAEAHYIVCYGRFNSLDGLDGEVIHTVKRQGVTLNTVIRVTK